MKLTRKKYSKVIVWMPTFRKTCNGVRVDGIKQQELGIPLISGKEDYQKLNNLLCKEDILLIIKIHPMQDLNDLKIFDCSNIKVLTGNEVKEKNIDNYRLLRCTDALISDYSSTAAEYFHMNKPIAYCLDDIHEYKIGFVIEDIQKLMPGNKIYSIEDMFNFIEDIENASVRDVVYAILGNIKMAIAEDMSVTHKTLDCIDDILKSNGFEEIQVTTCNGHKY